MTNYLVVGLPGSGKSHFLSTLSTDYHIYDDFLNRYHQTINEPFAIADPRFTTWETFVYVMSKLDPHKITLVLFDNNPQACKDNDRRRARAINCDRQIDEMSKRYDPQRYPKAFEFYHVLLKEIHT